MKKILIVMVLFLSEVFAICQYVNLGKFDTESSIFVEDDVSKLTKEFLDVEYVLGTLSNPEIDTSAEKLIIDFSSLDCFTFIDTIEALRHSIDFEEFRQKLIQTRYKDGKVTYHNRNHFFSDWVENNNIKDITCELGACKKSLKTLNEDYKYLKEIPEVIREIAYIPTKEIDLSKLQDGDYIGIYTPKEDLDVTHTGIIIKKDDKVYIRHASSKYKKVMDSELFEYTKNKEGVLIYRHQ
jgi:hypothetical protein